MSAISVQQMADRVATLMEERLGARGTGLEAKLKSRGRSLPRKVRQAAEDVARTAAMAQNPKLLLQTDHEALARNYDVCLRHLSPMKRHSGTWTRTVSIVTSATMSVLLVAALIVALMRWRGLI